MEPKNKGLEDDFPSQLGDFLVPAVNFQGCRLLMSSSLLIIAGPTTETGHFFGSASPELLGSWTS